MSKQRFKCVNELNDQLMTQMEQMLSQFVAGAYITSRNIGPEALKEIMGTCTEGAGFFQDASKGCAPVQKALTGAIYTLQALKEWRELGPLYGCEKN